MFRKDRHSGKGGGALIYIKTNLRVTLSLSINFTIAVLYNQTSHTVSFYDGLSQAGKQLEVFREIIWYGGFNINWSDKVCRQEFKNNND